MRLLRDLRACLQRDSDPRFWQRNLSRRVVQAWQQVNFENGGQAVRGREPCHSIGEVWPAKARGTESNYRLRFGWKSHCDGAARWESIKGRTGSPRIKDTGMS